MERYYSSTEAAKLAGITYRQLDYWTRTGIVVPEEDAEGSGTRRVWSSENIAELRAMGELCRLGIPVGVFRTKTIPEVIDELRRRLEDLDPRVRRETVMVGSGNPFGEVRGSESSMSRLLAAVG